jgi:hypothetical protein
VTGRKGVREEGHGADRVAGCVQGLCRWGAGGEPAHPDIPDGELGSEVNVIFTIHAPQVHHDIMIARFDKAIGHPDTVNASGDGNGSHLADRLR